MKKLPGLWPWALACLFLTFVLATSGCASKPKVDWDSTLLGDGSKVAEWFLKPGPSISFGLGTSSYGPSGGVGVGQSVALPTKGHFLRLVFGPDGQLQRWEKFRR